MRRLPLRPLLIGAGVVVLLASLVQLALPAFVAMKIEERLTKDGGSASVDLSAAPAWSLLSDEGDRISVDASGLELPLTGGDPVLDRLDGFGEVELRLRDTDTGPLNSRLITLDRAQGAELYRLRLEASTTPKELAAFAAREVGGFFGALATRLAAGEGGIAVREVPISMDVELRSEDGDPEVVNSDATVEGIPLGPLAEAIAGAVAARL